MIMNPRVKVVGCGGEGLNVGEASAKGGLFEETSCFTFRCSGILVRFKDVLFICR